MSSVILVTNHHVIGNEQIAGKSSLQFEDVDVELQLEELMVKSTYRCSDMNKVMRIGKSS